MSFADSFKSHFLICYTFSFLPALARTSSSVLKRSGDREHPCLASDLRGNTWFLAISCDTICRFAVLFIKNVPHIPSLQRVFIMNGYWILSDTFYQSIDFIMQFFLIMVILIDFPVSN